MLIIFYTLVIFLLLFPIFKIISYDLFNDNTCFLLLTNYILNIAVALFWGYFNNLLFSVLFCFILSIFAILLIKNFKKILGFYQLLSIPYLLMILFSSVYILILFIQSF